MESNHEKITSHVKKYKRTYSFYWSAYIIIFFLAVILNAPMLLVGIAPLIIIHILTKAVGDAELDDLKNKELTTPHLKDRHP